MFYDVVNQYEVIAQVFIAGCFHLHEVVADEVSLSACELKELAGLLDALRTDVDACRLASSLSEG